MALSLYRKYRPNVFADVVGQEHVEKTLVNAVAAGEVAHAYLFCGPRGTGKTTSARLLAKALLCENGPTPNPDGDCEQCQAIAEGTHPDVYELDAASRTGVENVREEIISRVQFAPTRGRYKVYIIDEVHMLSTAAFNALLKTLEEPPSHIVFVMCTTDPHKVPETIQSRCQRFDFKRFQIDEIVGYLQRICAGEGFEAQREALEFIASKAAGGMRDATTSLEQVAVASGGVISLEAARAQLGQIDAQALFELGGFIACRDTANAFLWLDQVMNRGFDLTQCAHDVASHMRNLYVAALTGGANGIIACPANDVPLYQQQASAFGGPERLSRAMTVCGGLVSELRNSTDARLSFEVALVKLCRAESELTLEALAERVESLENGIAAPRITPDLLSSMASQAVASAAAKAGVTPVVAVENTQVKQDVAVGETELKDDAPVPASHASENVPPVLPEQPAEEERSNEARQPDNPAVVPIQQGLGAVLVADDIAEGLPWEEPETVTGAPAEEAPLESVPAADSVPAQPAAPAQPAQPATTMSPARVLAAVLTEVKRQDVATGALLNGVTLEMGPRGYRLVFPAGGDFAMRLVRKGDAHEMLVKAFNDVLGCPTPFEYVAATQAEPIPSAPQFESVSATEAAAPPAFEDDGYAEAQAAFADASYDYSYDSSFGADLGASPIEDGGFVSAGGFDPGSYKASIEQASAPASQMHAETAEPYDDGFSSMVHGHASNIDEATASSIADTLSVFGNGIKLEEM